MNPQREVKDSFRFYKFQILVGGNCTYMNPRKKIGHLNGADTGRDRTLYSSSPQQRCGECGMNCGEHLEGNGIN